MSSAAQVQMSLGASVMGMGKVGNQSSDLVMHRREWAHALKNLWLKTQKQLKNFFFFFL